MKQIIASLFSITVAILSAAAIFPGAAPSRAADTNDPSYQMWQADCGATHEERMQWWRDARFGMFIHWGIYSVPAGVYQGKDVPGIGEWIMRNADIPVAEYAQYAAQFDPTNFDAL